MENINNMIIMIHTDEIIGERKELNSTLIQNAKGQEGCDLVCEMAISAKPEHHQPSQSIVR